MQDGYIKEKYHRIKEEGKSLLVGEHKYIICPFCQAEHEKKCCITRKELGYLFHCFRASCGKSGVVGEYYKSPVKDHFPSDRYKRYEGFLLKIPKHLWEERIGKYGINYAQTKFQGVKYAPDENRIYLPVFNYLGYQIGETLKAVEADQQPKNLSYRWTDVPLIHFPIGQRTSRTLVLVEDILSAMKVAQTHTCAALMGTHLSAAGFEMLKRNTIETIVMMLDGDALMASYKIANKYGSFAKFKIINTPEGKDPKDLSNEQIKILID
mgnify:CR=1 FL=1